MFATAVNRLFTKFCFLTEKALSSPLIPYISDSRRPTLRTTRTFYNRQPLTIHCSLDYIPARQRLAIASRAGWSLPKQARSVACLPAAQAGRQRKLL